MGGLIVWLHRALVVFVNGLIKLLFVNNHTALSAGSIPAQANNIIQFAFFFFFLRIIGATFTQFLSGYFNIQKKF